jgi:hypothetical protein
MIYHISRLVVLTLAAASLAGCRATRVVAAAFQSGAPSRAERHRIEDRTALMLRDLPSQRLLVLPVAVIGRTVAYDSAAALTLATRLRSDSLANAIATFQPMELPFNASSNESAILWSRFKALAASVQASPPRDVDYVMLIDVLDAPEEGVIEAVHVMVVNNRGEMAYHAGWNSAQDLHKQVRPTSINEAVRMVAMGMTQRRR